MCLIVARKLADPDPKITTIAVAPAFSLSWWSILFLFLTTVQLKSSLPYLRPSLGHFPSVLTTLVLTFPFAL
jgi:hypothetical protein